MKSRKISHGVENIKVHLIDYSENAIKTMSQMLKATWQGHYDPDQEVDFEIVKKSLGAKALGNALESVQMTFAIEGISRSCTHQLVRQRIGVGFMQEGGRDNDWSDFDYTIPEKIAGDAELALEFSEAVENCRKVYIKALESGVSWQDARFVCPIGANTFIIVTTNFRALQTFVARRLCNLMQWEINYVARLMVGEVFKVQPLLGEQLKCGCERAGVCTALNPTLFPPCGMFPLKDKDLLTRKYVFPKEANACMEFAEKDTRLGRKWLPNFKHRPWEKY